MSQVAYRYADSPSLSLEASTKMSFSHRSPERAAGRIRQDESSGEEKDEGSDEKEGMAGVSTVTAWLAGGLQTYLVNNVGLWEELCKFCFISIGAYIGAFFRIALTRLRVWEVSKSVPPCRSRFLT